MPINDLLKSIWFTYDGGDDQIYKSEKYYQLAPTEFKLESLPWKTTGSFVSLRCYHIDMASIKNMSSRIPKFIWLFSDYSFIIHVNSPNAWKKIEPANYYSLFCFDGYAQAENAFAIMDVAMDVMHMQDYAGEPCNHDPNYNFDECISEEVDRYY